MATHGIDAMLSTLRGECITPGRLTELYDVGPVLGKGGFSTVRSGVVRGSTGRTVALKILNPKAYLRDPLQAKQVFHEIRVMKRVNAIENGNLMRFVAAHEDVSATTGLPRLTIVTEIYTGGELFDRIVGRGHYSEKDAADLVAKLTRAFADLHRNNIIHRDLKPENVLYATPADDAEPILADFGLSRLVDGEDVHTGLVGTPGYVSPEIIRERKYTTAGDVWALGVLTYILLCGYPPFYSEHQSELYRQICAGVYEFHADAWGGISAGAKDLISRMLVVDDAKRLTTAEILSHPWIASNTITAHLGTTVDNLKKLKARMKIKAAATAVRLGAAKTIAINRELAGIVGGATAPFSTSELEALSHEFQSIAGAGGSITFEQFSPVMTKLGLTALPLRKLFEVFDVDGSGDVDYKELVCGLARLRSENDEAIQLCFKVWDANGDGSLSMTELARMLEATGFTGAGLGSLTSASPSTGAGTTGGFTAGAAATPTTVLDAEISAAIAATASLDEDERTLALAALFVRIDSNRDGVISYEEFSRAVHSEPLLANAIFRQLARAPSDKFLGGGIAGSAAAAASAAAVATAAAGGAGAGAGAR